LGVRVEEPVEVAVVELEAVEDGEEVEEISIPESWAVASRVGEPVPGRLWREERLERGAIE
jgi:hypothetical protein